MLRALVTFCFVVTACSAETTVTPAPVLCGETPPATYRCIGSPHVIPPGVASQCDNSGSECDGLKCVFRKMEFLNGEKVDTKKVTEFMDKFARDHTAWAPAVNHVKSACLSVPLRPQGVYLGCEPYDVMSCIQAQFLRHAQPKQWSTAADCTYPRQYAASCPVCPNDCFAPAVPYGSCNACLTLPRSP